MDLREFVRASLERTRQRTLQALQGLTPEQWHWRPYPGANSIAFLVFHIFRVEDRYFHRWLSAEGEVWTKEGWERHILLPPHSPGVDPVWTTGNSWTAADVEAWVPPPMETLLRYGERVRQSAITVLKGLDFSRLDYAPRADRPQFTLAYYLYQASHHEAEHQGQIDYLKGLFPQRRISHG
ncbi:MAG: DinB family protein [Dehalococcoidia bacterium]|nr:DinB family protein [Dehalococcoidia bacterium]